jgi:hypothetical protein
MSGEERASQCRRQTIMCTGVDERALNRLCALWTRYQISVRGQDILLTYGRLNGSGSYGEHNDWGRFKGRYIRMPIPVLGVPATLEQVRKEFPDVDLGRMAIDSYYCSKTYLEIPPRPADWFRVLGPVSGDRQSL